MIYQPKLLIGFCGHAGSGKNTAASLFRDKIITSVQRKHCIDFALADAIKEAAAKMFAVPVSYFNHTTKKEEVIPFWKLSPREMAQFVGTEMGRDVIGSDIWTKRLEITIGGIKPTIALVTDVRFQNEVDWIYNNGGFICHLTRKGADGSVGVTNHRSEQITGLEFISDRTWHIDNDGSLLDLTKALKLFYSYTRVNRIDSSDKSIDQSVSQLESN